MLRTFTLKVLLVVTVVLNPVMADGVMETIDRRIEEPLMERLAAVKQKYSNSRQPFFTDGCSGGLTSAWNYLSKKFPILIEQFGERTDVRVCCETHDTHYWKGETTNGFDKRLEADSELRQCVIKTGAAMSTGLINRYNLSEWEVDMAFKIAAGLMFQAVRVGGRPCTNFMWRWGYGYPECE